MATIKLSQVMKAEVISKNTIKVKTHQRVAGGGSRNLISWALTASRLGYSTMLVEISPHAPRNVAESIRKAIRNANVMLNAQGLEVREA